MAFLFIVFLLNRAAQWAALGCHSLSYCFSFRTTTKELMFEPTDLRGARQVHVIRVRAGLKVAGKIEGIAVVLHAVMSFFRSWFTRAAHQVDIIMRTSRISFLNNGSMHCVLFFSSYLFILQVNTREPKKKKNHDLFLLVHIYLGSASTTRAFLVSHTMTFAGLTEGDHLVVPVISLVPIPLVRMPTCLCIERYACFHLFSLKQVIHVAAP